MVGQFPLEDCGASARLNIGKRIIIIDDDQQVRLLLRRTLEKAGYQIIEADNGRIGMAHLREFSADMVITDLVMPDQEGLETIRAIKAQHPEVKVIAISGGYIHLDPVFYLNIAAKLGADAVFNKPIDRQRLQEKIAELLSTG